MKTKLVYVLVSSNNDIYLEQAYISMFSAKYYMPQSYIVLITDKKTESTFDGIRRSEIQYVNEIISIELDDCYTPTECSRILKTSVRKYLEGDYLFIDTDTIITKPLFDIDNIQADMAACWDTHAIFNQNPYRNMCIKHGKLLKWPIEKEDYYYNSGVIYVKDNKVARAFYDLWNKNWYDGLKAGVTMDQPSFAKTNYMLGHVVKTLDDVWNCELKHGIRYLKDAKIVHYLCTSISVENDQQVFLLNEKKTLLRIKETGIIDKQIKETIKDPFTGLASVVHVFSGSDLFFFRTSTFSFIHHMYNTKLFPFVNACMSIVSKIAMRIKRLINIKRNGGG